MRRLTPLRAALALSLLSTGLGAGCSGEGPAAKEAAPIDWCEGSVPYRYAPDEALSTFPDDHWTVADPSTATGLRVRFDASDPALAVLQTEYGGLLDQANTLDGFGLSPDLILRFDAPLPALDALDVRLLAMEEGGWVAQAFGLSTLDQGETLVVRPWRPLPPGARVVLAVTTDAADPGCLSPSPDLRALLTPGSEAPLAERYAEGLAALDLGPAQVGAMTVFTTQSALDVDRAVLADVSTRAYPYAPLGACTTEDTVRRCEGEVEVMDYRASDGIVPDGPVEAQGSYRLPVAIWLPPAELPGPYPVVMCGHGLGGSKGQCDSIARLSAAQGIATVGVDAQQHGDHPLRAEGDGPLDQIMALFGFTLSPPSLDTFVWRDNFRASAWDKLQIIAAIRQGLDADGDGQADLDGEHIQYAGASLGGIMGPELMAWGATESGVLAVPGGGMLRLVLDSDSFGIIGFAMTPEGWTEDDLQRTLPIVQMLIDPGDPLVHAAELSRRRAQGPEQDVLMLMALDDAIVPNSSTQVLAQAFEVEGVGRALLPIDGVTFTAGPLSANLEDGSTGALVEFDLTQPEEGAEWEAADHSTLHESVQGEQMMSDFLLDVLAGQTPVVVDPYAE